LFYFQVWKYS